MHRASRAVTSIAVALTAVAGVLLAGQAPAAAQGVEVVDAVGTDPDTDGPGQHRSAVEADTFARGDTLISAFQTGRHADGGAARIGVARRAGTGPAAEWTQTSLPGLTVADGGEFDRVSDPSVAHVAAGDGGAGDGGEGVWLVATLGLTDPDAIGAAVLVSRSLDGGRTWEDPVVAAEAPEGAFYDKPWLACDSHAGSDFHGRCYLGWSDNLDDNRIHMATSSAGGLDWGAPTTTAAGDRGLGVQPTVRPDGTVVVPHWDGRAGVMASFTSPDGGGTWTAASPITETQVHRPMGRLRSLPLPSTTVDGDGTVHVVWPDCRFRPDCRANDLVRAATDDGITWSSPTRVALNPPEGPVGHFIPGIAAVPGGDGEPDRLAVTYHWYPDALCEPDTCRLNVSMATSPDGGRTWAPPIQLNPAPVRLGWVPETDRGPMVGDYLSVSAVAGVAVTVFAHADAPAGGLLTQRMAAGVVDPGVRWPLTPRPLGTYCPAGDPDAFGDDDGTAAEPAIDCLAARGLVSGTGDGSFAPEASLTRAQAASLLARLLEAHQRPGRHGATALPAWDGDNAFADVADDSVHAAAINRLADVDVVRGVTAEQFRPREPATRAQLAALLHRARRTLSGVPLRGRGDAFTDDDGTVHEPVNDTVAAAGLMVGGDGRFHPRADTARGQAARALARFLALHGREGFLDPPGA